MEYEAKSILRRYSVDLPRGEVLQSQNTPGSLPAVLKSQVPVGGRGKLGGIKLVKTEEEARRASQQIRETDIKGFRPNVILAEELLSISREMYLALIINREQSTIELLAHPDGGVDIEAHSEESFYRHEINQQNIEAVGQTVADFLNIPEKSFKLSDLVERLYDCFTKEDVTLLEINPLALTESGDLIVADCKMELDDTATFGHPDWQFETRPADSNFVTLNQSGVVATVANGAGLAMATVDAVAAAGLKPANFLDIGGGATTEKVVESFGQIMKIPTVSSIVINIFGGIVKCDTVARAIVEASRTVENLPQLYIRLSGTNAELAKEILAEHNIDLYPNLAACLEAIKS